MRVNGETSGCNSRKNPLRKARPPKTRGQFKVAVKQNKSNGGAWGIIRVKSVSEDILANAFYWGNTGCKNLHNELFDVFGGDYLERCIRVGSVETFRTFHVGLTFVPFELKRT